MANPLSGLWLIGALSWDKDDCAHIAIAKTKTAARQRAERILAHAAFDWAKHADGIKEGWARHSKARYPDFEQYAQKWGTSSGCSDSYLLRQYLLLKSGIWLTGPNGQRLHVTEPSKKAMAERARWERKSAAFAENAFKSLIKSVKTKTG